MTKPDAVPHRLEPPQQAVTSFDKESLDGEYLDVLDAQGKATGQHKARNAIHRDGDWHRSFHLWVVREGRYVIFQRRAKSKIVAPDKIDTSVAGHLQAGETVLDALREAEEELGLYVEIQDIAYLHSAQVEHRYPDVHNREFQEVYVHEDNRELWEYVLRPQEVFVIYEIPIEAAIALYRHGQPVAAAGYDAYARHNNALLTEGDVIAEARADTLASLELLQQWLHR